MANLSEITIYKSKLMKTMLSDKKIVALLTNSDEESTLVPNTTLAYTQVFPYDFIPEPSTEQTSFICFDIDVPRTQTCAVKDVYIYIYIFTHKDLMRVQGEGIRTDLIASRVDYIINGDTSYGFGKVELQSLSRISPVSDFQGRILKYYVQDFNRICEKL